MNSLIRTGQNLQQLFDWGGRGDVISAREAAHAFSEDIRLMPIFYESLLLLQAVVLHTE